MAPLPSNVVINSARPKERGSIWWTLSNMEQFLLKAAALRARRSRQYGWRGVSTTLDWHEIASEMGLGVTAQYCRYVLSPACSPKVEFRVDKTSTRLMTDSGSERCRELWHHTDLGGGTLRADYQPVHRHRLRHQQVQEVKGRPSKVSKNRKSPSDTIFEVGERRQRLRREASLLSSFSKLMSPPKAKTFAEVQKKDSADATAEGIEAIFERQEKVDTEKAARIAEVHARRIRRRDKLQTLRENSRPWKNRSIETLEKTKPTVLSCLSETKDNAKVDDRRNPNHEREVNRETKANDEKGGSLERESEERCR
ncbi:MAG: hypothetical protein Q9187_007696 [Circinaria calcarea]